MIVSIFFFKPKKEEQQFLQTVDMLSVKHNVNKLKRIQVHI